MSELAYTRRHYTHKGEFLFAQSYEPLQLIETPASNRKGPLLINNDMSMEIRPAAKSVQVDIDYGYKANVMPDGDFPTDSFIGGIELNLWQQSENNYSLTFQKTKTGKDPIKGYGVKMRNSIGLGETPYLQAKWLSSPILQLSTAQNAALIVDIDYWAEKESGVGHQNEKAYFCFDVVLAPENYAEVQKLYHLSQDGGWIEQHAWQNAHEFYQLIEITSTSKQTLSIESVPLEAIPALTSGRLSVFIFEIISEGSFASPYSRLIVDRVAVELLHNDDFGLETETLIEVNPKPYTFLPEVVKLYHGDIPEYANNKLMYKHTLYLENGEPTRRWYRAEVVRTLQEHLLVEKSQVEMTPRQAISGTLRRLDDYPDMGYIMKDLANYGRLFSFGFIEWRDADCQYSFELLEVHPGEGIRGGGPGGDGGGGENGLGLEFEPLEFNGLEFN